MELVLENSKQIDDKAFSQIADIFKLNDDFSGYVYLYASDFIKGLNKLMNQIENLKTENEKYHQYESAFINIGVIKFTIVLKCMKEINRPVSTKYLHDCLIKDSEYKSYFKTESKWHSTWNTLNRLTELNYVEKLERGIYCLTEKAHKLLRIIESTNSLYIRRY